jgi:hypothetical protein
VVRHYLDLGAKINVDYQKYGSVKDSTKNYQLTSEMLETESMQCPTESMQCPTDSLESLRNREYPFDEPKLEEYEDDFESDEYMPIYIYDIIYGDGLYRIGTDNTEIDLVSQHQIDNGGEIAFRCNELYVAFSLVEYLRRLDYCACFGPTPYKMSTIKLNNGKTVLYMTFDCESG